jgi:hypothetical protein
MGCDIHIAIQVQDRDAWRHVAWRSAPYSFRTSIDGYPIAPKVFDARNYSLFGILADVRNGVGFGGITTGDAWPAIAPGRGYPDGFDESDVPGDPYDGPVITADEEPARSVARRLLGTAEPRSMGEHSQTWIALSELEEYAWDAIKRRRTGVVTTESFDQLREGYGPEAYSSDVSGGGVVIYTPSEYRAALSTGRLATRPYVRAEWTESARVATRDWPGDVLPWLRELSAGRPLRLVIGFDS